MREYSLANSLYWALAEGHACEQSARRNAMDVSIMNVSANDPNADNSRRTPPRTPVR